MEMQLSYVEKKKLDKDSLDSIYINSGNCKLSDRKQMCGYLGKGLECERTSTG